MHTHAPTSLRRMITLVAGIVLYAAPGAAQAPAKLKWGPAPPVFRPGARMAVVSGDPGKPGQYVVQLALPSRYRIAPHFHPTDENVLVKSGVISLGMGDKFDEKALKPMKAGEKGTVGANMHHYAMTTGRTVLEVSGMGPFVLTYVDPADDPSKKEKKEKKDKKDKKDKM